MKNIFGKANAPFLVAGVVFVVTIASLCKMISQNKKNEKNRLAKEQENTIKNLDKAKSEFDMLKPKEDEVSSESFNDAALKSVVTRESISIFRRIEEAKDEKTKMELTELLSQLKKKLNDYKVGAAVGAGDCFFDSVAQGLNELKSNGLITSNEEFNVKSLRKSCKQYAKESKQSKSSSWLNKALKKEKDSIKKYVPRIEFTAKDIEDSSSNPVIGTLELKDAICGRNKIEGEMICGKYNMKIKVIELHEEPVDGLYITTDEVGTGDNVVCIVNYRSHFVPLLYHLEKELREDVGVSMEEVYGEKTHRKAEPIEDRNDRELQILNRPSQSIENTNSKGSKRTDTSLHQKQTEKKDGKEKKAKVAEEKKGDKSKKIDLSKLLSYCKELMRDAIGQGGNFFELLDPLVSDTQCHIHSLLILSILSKFYDSSKLTYNTGLFEKLDEGDKKALSCAVLLSLFKFEWKDKFGFTVHEISLESFPDKFTFKSGKELKSGKKLIAEAKQYLNSCSVDYINSVSNGKLKDIFDKCKAELLHSSVKLKSLPCYASMYAVMCDIKKKKLPVIISLVRVNGKKIEESYKYTLGKSSVFFYEWQEDKNAFCYKQALSKSEEKQPAIVFCCYSIIGKHSDDNSQFNSYIGNTGVLLDEFLTNVCDVINLIMLCSARPYSTTKKC